MQNNSPLPARSLSPIGGNRHRKFLRWRLVPLVILAISSGSGPLLADPVAVRFLEGSVHGFLVIRSPDSKVLAAGDLIQTIRGDRLVSHLAFQFKDGSIDDETAVFSQRGEFRLLSDHHIQKGPAFPNPVDLSIDAPTGRVTIRYQEKGRQKLETEHLDLPSDLANGIILNVLKNIPVGAKETKVSYLAASPKPRLVKLSITTAGKETFSVAGAHHQAVRFLVKVELGGIAGMIAPLIGKQPADIQVWVVGGEAPAFVKSEGPLYLGGPVWSTEMTSPVWRRE